MSKPQYRTLVRVLDELESELLFVMGTNPSLLASYKRLVRKMGQAEVVLERAKTALAEKARKRNAK